MRVTIKTRITRYGSRDSMDTREWEETVTVSAEVRQRGEELEISKLRLDEWSMPGKWRWSDLEDRDQARIEDDILETYTELSDALGHPADLVGSAHE